MALRLFNPRPSIFISYRREDTRLIVGRIFDRLVSHFGKASVFIDLEDLPVAAKFRDSIRLNLERCTVLLAIIGPEWSGGSEQDRRRILDERDVLRQEIETALTRGILVIPVLIDRAVMPPLDTLPPSLHPLTELLAAEVSTGRDFDSHMRHIIDVIEQRSGKGVLPALADHLKRHAAGYALTGLGIAVAFLLGIAGYQAEIWTAILGSEQARAVRSCNRAFALSCAQAGGAFGSFEALAGLKRCKDARLIRSDETWLQWKDVWTTSVSSVAPQGGGPGGKDDDVLRVGGSVEASLNLIKFNLPLLIFTPQFAALALYPRESEGPEVSLALDRIVDKWDVRKGDALLWKDRPGHRPVTTDPLPAPRKAQWYIVEFTALVDEWLDRKAENLGIQIRGAEDVGGLVQFASSDASDKAKIPHLILCD